VSATQARFHRLPSVTEIERAGRALIRAHEACEIVESPVKRPAESGEYGDGMAEMPTRADIGELYRFACDIRVRSTEFAGMAQAIEDSLPVLGSMAENAALAETV